jgi:hypothetical protein
MVRDRVEGEKDVVMREEKKSDFFFLKSKIFENFIKNDDVIILRRPLMLAQNVIFAKTFHKQIQTYLRIAHTLIHNAHT